MSIGVRIKVYREMNGWSQDQLAEKVGVTRGSVSQWENGINKPRMGMVEKLSAVLNVPVSKIIEDKNDISEEDTLEAERQDRLIEAFVRLSPEMKEAAIAAVRGMAGM